MADVSGEEPLAFDEIMESCQIGVEVCGQQLDLVPGELFGEVWWCVFGTQIRHAPSQLGHGCDDTGVEPASRECGDETDDNETGTEQQQKEPLAFLKCADREQDHEALSIDVFHRGTEWRAIQLQSMASWRQ